MRSDLPEHLVPLWEELSGQVRGIPDAGLEALCGQVYRLRDAERRISDEGLIVSDSRGNPVPHPALDVERKTQAEIHRWLSKYGSSGGGFQL